MRSLNDARGQATVLVVLFVAVLLGMAAAVLDVGAWFRADRATQAAADAAALAGAHALPQDPAAASALAVQYADKNGGGIAAADVTISTTLLPNDTITVEAERPAPGFFAKVFDVDSVTVHATAKARVGNPSSARWAAPIAVDWLHPLISSGGCPCFNEPTALDIEKVGPGAFRLINLDDSHGGTGPGDVGDWIRYGYDGYMPIDWYYSDPGIKPNSSLIKSALDERIGDVLLFPVYRETQAQGAGFEYQVIGWVGFRLSGYTIRGTREAKLYGKFESITWEGIMSEALTDPNFGVRIITLLE